MSDVYTKLKELGIELPAAAKPGGVYSPVKAFGATFLYCSGCDGNLEGEELVVGKLGQDLTVEQGQAYSRNCMLKLLANLQRHLGDLNRIKRFVKILAFVQSTDDFHAQPQVVNGASTLLREVFGDEIGLSARSAIGTNALPGNVPVEIELLVEYE
jgi:enamine deaminase RidA (YjgF/YER057c/UK114 family)